MKIVVLGTRGIPGIMGGVETHCEELYPRIAGMGADVTLIRRKSYVREPEPLSEYKGVKLVDVYNPRGKSFEAIVHTFLAVLKARTLNPDVVHIHAIGPSMMAPLARLLGMKVVTTNHGPDYDRQKWGKAAKAVLKFSERMGAMFSNKVIVISKVIAGILSKKYGRKDTVLIYNGVTPPQKSTSRSYLRQLGLADSDKYIVALGRFVKEKGFHDLIAAYKTLGPQPYKLVLAGDCDHPDQYSSQLKEDAKAAGVLLTGFIKGEKLNQVMTGASLFVLPSYHEGLPIVLLEAMSYGLDVLVSDIPANKIHTVSDSDFFHAADVADLTEKLRAKLSAPATPRLYDLSAFNWDTIARQTLDVYTSVIKQ